MENNNAGWIEKLIQALDEERQKVEVFRRELPLSLHLINQTIESYKQLMATDMNNPSRQQELAAKELISLRPSSMSSSEEDTTKQLDREEISGSSNRMRPTLQLFAQDQQDHPLSPAMIGGLDSNSQDNFEKGEHVISIAPVTSEDVGTAYGGEGNDDDGGDDTGSDGEENLKKNQKPHSKRKARRYWSEELQKRFLLALEQLGGCHAATPRRIQKLMKVEGLTNAEIKSHLQKFRIRKKRTNPTLESRIPSINSKNNNEDNNFEATNFAVVVRGIWIPTVDSETGKLPQLVPLNSPLMLGNENFQNATKHARR